MKITRMFTGSDGESHFEDMEISFKETANASTQESETIKATSIFFRQSGVDYQWGWHNASHRQFLIVLEGGLEIEVGDGTKRRFGPGDILLAEDTTGKGHISRAVDNQPRASVFVTLD